MADALNLVVVVVEVWLLLGFALGALLCRGARILDGGRA